MSHQGSCLCGAVIYHVNGSLRPVMACHCTQCRKTSGHFVAATSAPRSAIDIQGQDSITWFESSPGIRRGFCTSCGSHLFWDVAQNENVSIFAGSLDGATGLTIDQHIFCAQKGDYYELADDAPRHDAYPDDS